jgi:hypothetical protein
MCDPTFFRPDEREGAFAEVHDGDAHLWALDLTEGHWPCRAHLITCVYHDQRGEVAVSACGQEFAVDTLLKAWWSTPRGELPLRRRRVHCGRQQVTSESDR